MDPRLLLDVGPRPTRASVRSAQRRLRAAVDPRAGGTDGLVDLIDAAAEVIATGRGADRLEVDPHRVLGVTDEATPADVRATYRRLARLVHPDRGGTDELFRVVAAAAEVLGGVRPAAAGTRRRRSSWTPPPPPPPRRPYRAPDPAMRHVPSRWRAWRDLAEHAVPLVVGVLLAVAASVMARGLAVVVLVGGVVWFGSILRPSIDGTLRAITVLRGARVKVAAEVEPERFLEDRCLDAPVGRQREDDLYDAYVRWCPGRGEPVAPWVFVERLRSLGLLYVKASAWDTGLWVGVVLRR
jgi:hypothetical protein